MVHNVELLGHTHNLDKKLFAPVAKHMEQVGRAAGFLVNQHYEYDLLTTKSQIPGGMIGTLKAQLKNSDCCDMDKLSRHHGASWVDYREQCHRVLVHKLAYALTACGFVVTHAANVLHLGLPRTSCPGIKV